MKGYSSSLPLFDLKPPAPPMQSVDPNVHEADKPRLSRNNLAVLKRLKQGPATTLDLMGPDLGGIRPGARVFDLKKSGVLIDSKRVEEGVAIYTLLYCPEGLA